MKKIHKSGVLKKIAIIVVCAISIALIISGSVMLSNHTNEVLQRAKTQSTNQSLVALTKVEDKVAEYTNYAASTAGSLQEKNLIDAKTQLGNLRDNGKLGLKAARYMKNDQLFCDKSWVDIKDGDLAINYVKSVEKANQKPCFLGTNADKMPEYEEGKVFPVDLYEFYAPIDGNLNFDGIAFYFDTKIFEIFIGDSFRNADSLMSTLIKDNGSILTGGDALPKSTAVEMLNEYGVFDTTIINQVKRDIAERKSDTVLCKIKGLNHVISIQFNNEISKDLGIFEVYECSKLAKETNDLINAIIAIIVVFIVIIVCTVLFLTVSHFRMQRKINNAEKHDLKLDCLNRFGFEKEADEILHREAGSYYAVIVLELRHFKFLVENFGETEVNSLLKYIKLTLTKTCRIEEIYGHMDNGQFLLLLHSTSRADLIDRLKIHSFLASQYKGSHKFDVAIKYGIYEYTEGEQTSVNKMIDYALEANNTVTKATVENVDMQFNFYDDELRKIRLINDDMELRQDSALRDGEFQVFYQAKYNLRTHKQDGAEALVRWYDKKTGEYNKPALFMPLFESNGFIEKLDKYVYTKVCEYISYSLHEGRNVFPVSVNVSRITATQPDFVDYYTRIKKKYGISNGALTIEFTESFAYENYDVLKTIVDRLHKAGFKTSIDDFGCGYSSYRILKELPMDEIKLDKFFIDYSENPERINSIFESVIALAKKLDMKVTQEGVERPEDVELLKKLGCDVIQGYIYSHPLSLTDYLHFVENTKDHNL
ncbi:MAG: GGDEF domain-containing protein [Firmicutes bacterium]|nr:GGDEF domain-containing protein [Candidatus Fiminaster equi]